MRIDGVRSIVAVSLVGLVVLAACTGASTGPGELTGTATPARSAPAATAQSVTASPAPTAARAAFLSYAFTDVRDGSQFKLSEFAGKQVLVIGMAVW